MTTPATLQVDPELARQALGDVLDADAASQPAADPPPRRVYEGATPEAPYGFKADGTPRKAPPGPGRPRLKDKDNAARVEPPSSSPASSASSSPSSGAVATVDGVRPDYTEAIASAFVMGWMGLSAIPFTQAHALMIHRHMGEMIPAWNKAAQQNESVRRAVLRLSGEGSWGWVLPVAATTTPFVLSLVQVTLADPASRAELKLENQQRFREFLLEQAEAAGLAIPSEDPAPDPASQTPADHGQSDSPSPTPTSSPSSPGSSEYLLEV